MLGDAPKTNDEPGVVLQPKVMTAGELEELKKEAQVHSYQLARYKLGTISQGSRYLGSNYGYKDVASIGQKSSQQKSVRHSSSQFVTVRQNRPNLMKRSRALFSLPEPRPEKKNFLLVTSFRAS